MVNYKIHVDKEQLLKAVDRKMDEIADNIFANSQQNIVKKKIVDRGLLLQSGNVNREFLDKEIVYPVPYAKPIEYGRNPGSMPPVNSLKGWVKRKFGITDETENNNIAWAIAMDIKKNGLMPRPFLRPAIEAAKIKFGGR